MLLLSQNSMDLDELDVKPFAASHVYDGHGVSGRQQVDSQSPGTLVSQRLFILLSSVPKPAVLLHVKLLHGVSGTQHVDCGGVGG
jgi:hypothetical protein